MVSAEPVSSSVSQIEKRGSSIRLRPRFFSSELFDVIRDAMKFLRADDEVDMRQAGEKRVAARLRHAAEKTEDDFRPALRDLAEHSHLSERLLIRHVANAAGIEEDDVRLRFVRRALVTTRQSANARPVRSRAHSSGSRRF